MGLKNKKWLYFGLGAVGLGVLAYYQYTKLMNFKLSFNSVRVNSLGLNGINLNLFFNFTNYSSLKVELLSQNYTIYINDIYAATLSNTLSNIINPKANSIIGVNVNLSKSDISNLANNLKGGLLDFLDVQNIRITIREQIKIKIAGFIPYTLNYDYKTTIKEMTADKSKI